MRKRIARVQFNCSLELSFCVQPVPVEELSVRQGSMCLSKSVIKLQSLFCRSFGFRKSLSRWQKCELASKLAICVSQPCVGKSVAGVFVYRLLEVVDGLLYLFHRCLVCVISALQIKLIRLRICHRRFCQTSLVFAGQPHPQIP